MNCNMMCRIRTLLLPVLAFVLLWCGRLTAQAQGLPGGEILIAYEDGATEDTYEEVLRLVQTFTWQNHQVVYAPVSSCLGNLADYDGVVFFDLQEYPVELLGEIYQQERTGSERFLFIGNRLLSDYLNSTGRYAMYTSVRETSARMEYTFRQGHSSQTLIHQASFLFLKEPEKSEGSMETNSQNGYFSATKGMITHLSATDLSDPLVLAAFTREAARWCWPYQGEPDVYGQYLVVDGIYPFQSREKLKQIIDLMAEEGQPFVLSVMPIYEHGDYPAMQRFCEVLRYAQDRGGAVFLHAPIDQMQEFDADQVDQALTQAVSNYLAQGVYPMGLEVPYNWMFQADTAEVMSHFNTILVSDQKDERIQADKELMTNLVYQDFHQWIAPAIPLDDWGVSWVDVQSSAVFFSMREESDQIRERIRACQESYVPMKSAWDSDHSFWTNEDIMKYHNHRVVLNGTQVSLKFEPTEYEEYAYHRNVLERFSKDLTGENRKLLAAVVVVALLFVLFIFLARRNNRKRFFLEEEDPEEYWENKG